MAPVSDRAKHFGWFSKPTTGHLVQFYQSEEKLLGPLTEYTRSGLLNGDSCIVIATQRHIKSLDEHLLDSGLDIAAVKTRGQYIVLDADETLAKFMVNNLPNRDRFFKVVEKLVSKAAESGRPIRAYGEMVAVLWKAGKKEAVLQLEKLWNEVAESHEFSLYCAYPKLHFVMDTDAQSEIKACHNVVMP